MICQDICCIGFHDPALKFHCVTSAIFYWLKWSWIFESLNLWICPDLRWEMGRASNNLWLCVKTSTKSIWQKDMPPWWQLKTAQMIRMLESPALLGLASLGMMEVVVFHVSCTLVGWVLLTREHTLRWGLECMLFILGHNLREQSGGLRRAKQGGRERQSQAALSGSSLRPGLLDLSLAGIFWGVVWLHLRIICLEDRR